MQLIFTSEMILRGVIVMIGCRRMLLFSLGLIPDKRMVGNPVIIHDVQKIKSR